MVMKTRKPGFSFLHDAIYRSGVRQRVVAGRVLPEPVVPLGSAGQWDERRCQFSTVLFDASEKLFRMYYLALGDEPECEEGHGPRAVVHRGISYITALRQCYAQSRDGVNWEKPRLGVVEYKGSKNNNILSLHGALPGKPLVIEDPEDGEHPHRFKMLLSNGGGASLAFSQDGIHWESFKGGANLYRCGMERGLEKSFDLFTQEPYGFIRDTLSPRKLYRVYTQASSGHPFWTRRTGMVASKDARRWKVHPRPLMGLPDGCAGISGQIHGLAVMIYRGYYVAFVHLCLPHPKTGWLAPRTHLAISTNGESFRIFEDDALIGLGPAGSWWEGGVTADSVLQASDEILCYFSGLKVKAAWDGNHQSQPRPEINTGLAKWDMDRLLAISLKPGFSEGYFLLPAMEIERDGGLETKINADLANTKTDLQLSLLHSDSRLVADGYGFGDFVLNKSDAANFSGKWAGRPLKAGSLVIPCFKLTGTATQLYSATFQARDA